MLLPLPFQAPAVESPAPPKPSYADFEAQLLDRLDLGQPLGAAPPLKGRDRAAYAWLSAAAAWTPGHAPMDPFAPRSEEHKEAQALRSFLQGALPARDGIAKLPLKLTGSRLLLWRWMKAREAKAPLPLELHRAVEDRLLEPGPSILRGWALRHALCFTVAERDLAHFATLRQAYGTQVQALFTPFQSLLALLDGPSPLFRMWRLPGLDYLDQSLGDLGGARVWIAPITAPPPPGTAWIIPSDSGDLGDREARLVGAPRKEADALSEKLEALGRTAWFAASSTDWVKQGLSYFPILIELDAQKNIVGIQMGDAAPAQP